MAIHLCSRRCASMLSKISQIGWSCKLAHALHDAAVAFVASEPAGVPSSSPSSLELFCSSAGVVAPESDGATVTTVLLCFTCGSPLVQFWFTSVWPLARLCFPSSFPTMAPESDGPKVSSNSGPGCGRDSCQSWVSKCRRLIRNRVPETVRRAGP